MIAHGTADGAVQAFVADASLEEHAALRADCQRFLAATKAWPWREVKAEVRRLGGAWTPRSRKALAAVFSSPDLMRPR